MSTNIKAISLIAGLGFASAFTANAQNFTSGDGDESTLQLNTITTAMPVLMIAPDSRSGALGDAGVSLSPDANAMHWNVSKLAFVENELGVSVSYTPWLRQLVPDINLAYLSGYKKLDDKSAIGASLRYFSLGDITFTDAAGNTTGQFKPNEFAVDVGYARKLSEKWSAGIAGRFIYSNLTGGYVVEGATSKAGISGAADLSTYYTSEFGLGDKDATFNFGVNISNIGAKMSYTNSSDQDFIPINLRFGPSVTIDMDEFYQLTFAVDFNKLLVPTTPIYDVDTSGQFIPNGNGGFVVASGRDPNVGVAAGMFGSFNDAPGVPVVDSNGDWVYNSDGTLQIEKGSIFKEEMREINISAGVEYWYAGQLALRAGYFHEHYTKGDRRYFTFGAGLKYSVFALDFAYLIATKPTNPLRNTLRFTLRFNFEKKDDEG